jgi:hypothetical protein
MRKSTEPPWALHFDEGRENQHHKSNAVHLDRQSRLNSEVSEVPGLQHDSYSDQENKQSSDFDDEGSWGEFAAGNGIDRNKRQIKTTSVASGEWKRPPSMAPRWAAAGVQELLVGSPTRGRKVSKFEWSIR